MDNSFILRYRNRLFTYLFAVGILFHIVSYLFISYEFTMRIPVFAIIYCGILLILQKAKMNEKVMQFLLLSGLNGYILNVNIDSPHFLLILLFIYPLFVASLYHSIVPNLILLPITLFEVIYLFNYSYDSIDRTFKFADLNIIIFLFLFMGITAIIHSIIIQKNWKLVEEQHSSMERALLSKEGYLQLFFENAKEGIAVFDLNSRVIEVNPAFEQLYGWSKVECIGNHIPLVPPENTEAALQRSERVLDGETFHLLETKEMRKNGTYFDGQLTLSPIFDQKEEMVAMSVITRDISYKKEAEKLLVQSEKLKLAGEIAAGVAHEIRNPMTVISGFIQMMNQDNQHIYHGYTKLIQSELERINLIISEFLVLAKPHVMTTKEFQIEETLQYVVMLFRPELILKDIELNEGWNTSNTFVVGEQNQIKQVFINILKNAIEALGQNGKLWISTDIENERMITIRFRDNGFGMTPDVINRIFEPFFTTKIAGTGLGMMITDKIIKEHGGSIHINSKVGIGTEVSISLPFRDRKKCSSD
jgi:PAS domain S-box-containing protein